ncbi:hypothetical protein G6F68_001352 [Rhizopus microsporus]|nr:hypothetical protein G6F68_001352 [Rhizopus microsporus]
MTLYISMLLAGLTATLSNYGIVRDIGVVNDNATSTFLSSGYAILDVSKQSLIQDESPFLELSHVITWVDPDASRSDKLFILANWNDMSTYCHESGHIASSCPKSLSGKRICFFCLKRGHVRTDCPERTSATKRRRNGRSVARPPSSIQSASNLKSQRQKHQVNSNLPTQEVDQSSPSSISPVSATAEVYSNAEMDAAHHSFEYSKGPKE